MNPDSYSDAAFWVDIGVLVWLLVGLIGGAVRGLSRELGRGLLAVGALSAGGLLYRPVGAALQSLTGLSPDVAAAAGFVAVAVVAILALLVVGRVFQWLVNFTFRGPIERFGGAVAGLVGAIVTAAIVLVAARLLPAENVRQVVAEQSWFGRRVCATFPALYRQWADQVDALQNAATRKPATTDEAAGELPAPATTESPTDPETDAPDAPEETSLMAPDDGAPPPAAVDGWGRPLDPADAAPGGA